MVEYQALAHTGVIWRDDEDGEPEASKQTPVFTQNEEDQFSCESNIFPNTNHGIFFVAFDSFSAVKRVFDARLNASVSARLFYTSDSDNSDLSSLTNVAATRIPVRKVVMRGRSWRSAICFQTV